MRGRRPGVLALGAGLAVLCVVLVLCGTRAEAAGRDFYAILGVPRDADERTIKSAYRRLSLKWHPDKNKDNAEYAKQRFQEIGEAKDVLTDEQRRARYDAGEDDDDDAGPGGFQGGFGGADISDILRAFSGMGGMGGMGGMM